MLEAAVMLSCVLCVVTPLDDSSSHVPVVFEQSLVLPLVVSSCTARSNIQSSYHHGLITLKQFIQLFIMCYGFRYTNLMMLQTQCTIQLL